MDLTLSTQDQSAIHQLLLAAPDPHSPLLPRSALEALARLIPCDVVGVGEADDTGYLLTGWELPESTYGYLGPQVCDSALPTGVVHLTASPDEDGVLFSASIGVTDVLRSGFATPAGTVVQVFLDRRSGQFDGRDVAILRLVEPLLGRLSRTRPRLAADETLSGSEIRVLELVAAGGSNRDVAEHLSISVATVRKHLEHCYRKLGVTNRTAAVAALTDSLVGAG